MPKSSLVVLTFLAFTCSSALNAQGNDTASLRELIVRLPLMTPTERLNLGPFTEAIEAAYKRDPASLESTVKGLQADLESADPWIQRVTAVLVVSLSGESNNPKFVLHFTDQLAKLIASKDEYTSGSAIYAVSFLGQTMPDNVVNSLLAAIHDKNSPDRVSSSAVGVVLAARPNNAQVEDAFLSALDDPDRSQQDRCHLLFNAGGAEGLLGQRIVDRIVKVVNSSPPSECRDAAIGAANRVGLRALNSIVSKLRSIEGDPNESKESRERASRALDMQLHSVR